jgi:hypothetical protein
MLLSACTCEPRSTALGVVGKARCEQCEQQRPPIRRCGMLSETETHRNDPCNPCTAALADVRKVPLLGERSFPWRLATARPEPARMSGLEEAIDELRGDISMPNGAPTSVAFRLSKARSAPRRLQTDAQREVTVSIKHPPQVFEAPLDKMSRAIKVRAARMHARACIPLSFFGSRADKPAAQMLRNVSALRRLVRAQQEQDRRLVNRIWCAARRGTRSPVCDSRVCVRVRVRCGARAAGGVPPRR